MRTTLHSPPMRLPRNVVWVLLVFILMLAAAVRLTGLSWAPPQFNQDEASNAYDAYCLLQSGMDRWQHRWPLMLRAFGEGDNRPPLYAYCVMPFLSVLGMDNVAVATRMPAALGGVATVACFFVLAYRTFGSGTALWTALFLAVSPWHVQLTRLGHESSLTPIFWPAALMFLSLAGWRFGPPDPDSENARGRRWPWMAAFGAALALAPYSYASQRAFMPIMLLAAALIFAKELLREWRDPISRKGWYAAAIAFALVISPLVYLFVNHWQEITYRSLQVSIFHQPKPIPEGPFLLFLKQYLAHYGPEWLFQEGDQFLIQATPGVGVLHWALAPLVIVGLMVGILRLRTDRRYALLFAWLLLYPVASAPTVASPHALRAAVGIGLFEWWAAIGMGALMRAAVHRHRLQWALCGLTLVALAAAARHSLDRYFRVFSRSPYIQALYQYDLVRVFEYLRNRHQHYDRVFISDARSQQDGWISLQPYIYALCYLPMEPREFWVAEVDRYYPEPNLGFEIVDRIGKFTFTLRPEVWREQFEKRPHERVLILSRPGDIQGAVPIEVIRDRFGKPLFEVIEIIPPPPASGDSATVPATPAT